MKKNIQKPLSVVLSLTMLASLVGCTNNNDTGAYVGESTSALESTVMVESELIEDDILVQYFENLLDQYPGININYILENPYGFSEEVQMVAGYANLKNHGLTLEDVKENLHFILTLGQVPRCASEEEFTFACGKLLDIVPERVNPFSAYFALAKMVHIFECPHTHAENEYGIFSCESLMNEYNALFKEISIEEFLDKNLFDNDLYLGLKEYTIKNGKRMDDIVWELENVVTYGLLPGMGMLEEEWNILFGNLSLNTGPMESLFEKYAPLARDVHNLLYPDDKLALGDGNTMLIRVKKES